ncbi:MAG: hypothetical protein Q7U75_07020 [Desulfobacterales bacterium]|nr:hypothetical protein [Desulfobacterales bacterium]
MITIPPPPHRQPLRFEIGETRIVRFDFSRCLEATVTTLEITDPQGLVVASGVNGQIVTCRFACPPNVPTASVTLTAATLGGHVARAQLAVTITDPSATTLEVDP